MTSISCSKMRWYCGSSLLIGALLAVIGFNAVVVVQSQPAEGFDVASVSAAEIRDILSTEVSARNVVSCLIKFVPELCDSRLADIEETLPNLIKNHFKCVGPACSTKTQANVKVFVNVMQRKWPSLWRKLITSARRR